MRKRLKRTVAALVLVALTALSVILVISMSGDSVSAGMREGTIGFSDEGAEIQKESLSQPVLENSSAALYLSENGSVTFLDKNTGVTYSNTAGEAGKGVFSNDDNELESPVILHYLAEQKNQSVIYSLDQSVLKGQYRLYREGDSVCVEYIIGEKTDEEILPEIISVEKFENEIIPELSDDDAEYLNRRYRKYYVGSDDPEQQPDDSVVEKFPILKEEAYYISVSMDAVKMRQRTMEILKEAGYTEADMKEDYEKSGYSDNENPLTFGITLKYRLEGNQLVVTVPHDSIRFYSDNPLLSVELMKYFTCSVGDEGYFVIPSGSGALMRFGKGSVEASFSQKVYGDDAVVRQTTIPYEMSEESSSYMLPMYGMCTDGLSVMAIIEGGASQAELSVYRNSEGARAGFLFTVTQSDYAAIGNADRQKIVQRQKEVNARIESIISGIDADWSDYRKEKYIHDYVAANMIYDNDAAAEPYLSGDILKPAFDIYGAFINKTGVCEAYAKMFQVLCYSVGINANQVTGVGHMWNVVRLDGEWYQVDVTWDDSGVSSPMHSGIRYNYFNLPAVLMEKDGSHTPDGTLYVPDCVSYKYFFGLAS